MQIFKKIDQYTFLLSKFTWSEDDKLTSICIDLQQEDEYSFKGDVRVIWPEALMGYLELVFKELFVYDRKSYKDAVMLQLRDMYKRSTAETRAQLLSKIDYARPLFKHQLNAICLLVQHRCNLLSFDMGLGKALKHDAKILTPFGWRLISSLKVGDDVYGSNGSATSVTGVYPQGIKEIFKVEFTDGSFTECCDEHLWNVQSPNQKKRKEGFRTLRLREIMNDLTYPNGNLKHYIPMVETVFFKDKPTPIDPYIMGVLLGDGSFRNRRIHFSTKDDEVLRYFDLFLPSDLKIKRVPGSNCDYSITGDGISNSYTEAIRNFGLLEKYSNEKFIPEIYIHNHHTVRLQILRGLLDSDGYISKDGTIQFYSTSEKLVDGVKELVQSFGGIARKTKKRGVYKKEGVSIDCKICFILTINLPKDITPFKLSRKTSLLPFVKKYHPTRGIKKVTSIGNHEAICISVDTVDNLFVTGDFVLTHNTITSATLSKILDYKRTVIIAPSGVKWNWLHDMCDDWGYDPIHWTILDAVKSRNQYAFLEKFVVANYDIIEKHRIYLESRNVDHFIIDEAHLLKNSNTQRAKSVQKLLEKFPNARITLLTGTPITNRIDDMFSYYRLTGHILSKNKSEFSKRYLRRSNGESGKVIGAKNVGELRVRHSNLMIRKRTEECIDLPPLLINKYWMDEEEMSKEYHDLIKTMYQNRIALAAEPQDKKTISQLQNLVSTNVHSLNRILATCKVKKIIELIDQMWAEKKKAVVFSGYSDPLNLLEKHYGDRCVKIDGSVNSYNRSVLIEKYKKDKNCHVFLGNDQAAGVGINLVNSCDVITMNFPFTPDRIEQPYKRTHRIGQVNTVNVYFTFVKNSIDEHIYSIVVDKSVDINNLLDSNRKGTVNYESDVMNLVFNRLLDKYAKDNNLPQIPQEQFQEI